MAPKPIMTDPPEDFPSRLAPKFYNERMEAYLGWKKKHFPELKAMIEWMNGIDGLQITTTAEVEAARGGEQDLLTRFTGIDNLIANLTIGAVNFQAVQKISDETLVNQDLGGTRIFHNTGATGPVNLTLPTGGTGKSAGYLVTETFDFKLTAQDGERFRYGTAVGNAGGYIRCLAPGTMWRLVCIGTDWWVVDHFGGMLFADE